jgi:hypothetical protein
MAAASLETTVEAQIGPRMRLRSPPRFCGSGGMARRAGGRVDAAMLDGGAQSDLEIRPPTRYVASANNGTLLI